MWFAPKKLRPGDELTSGWLNHLLALARRALVQPGANSGLSVNQNDNGTWLRLSQPNVQAQLAYTSSTITARSGTTAGTGTVYLVDVSVVSGTCTLSTTAVQITVYSFSGTTGGIASGKYCWIEQDVTGNYFLTSSEC
jgi:hypothetical protein